MTRLAYVGLDRQLYLVGPRGEDPVRLTSASPPGTGAWGARARAQDGYSWPTWSPDGEWIACFVVEGSDDESGPVRIVTLSLDGVRQVEWHQLQGAAPIYLQWHVTGDALTVLAQQDDDLQLGLLHRDRLGTLRPLESGIPLFFNWTPDGARVLIHVGSRSDAGRLVLRDPMGDAEDVLYPEAPGSFCAPVFPAGMPVYATRGEDGTSHVVRSALDGSEERILWSSQGLLAVVAAPHGAPLVAVSAAPRGEGTPYEGLVLIDVYDGSARTLTDAICLAYFWLPAGDALLYAVVDKDQNCITWHRVTLAGGTDVVATFWPTRDLLFYLHFFDQYAASHPIVSADGRWLAFAGYPAGGGQADLSAPPRIYVKDLHDLQRPALEVGNGQFAVFPATPATAR